MDRRHGAIVARCRSLASILKLYKEAFRLMSTRIQQRPSAADFTTRAIFEHAARISREQDLDQLIRLNADFARDLAGADRCSLWLIDEKAGTLWTRHAHGVDPIRIPLGQGIVGSCISQDQTLRVNDATNEPRLMRRVDEISGYHTEQVLCVPMRADGKVIGALQLLNKRSGFTEADAGLLALLAHFAATAIHSERLRQEALAARLLRHELDLARDVQFRLLPSTPTAVPGIDCVGFCRPARLVGGDYYDLLPLENGGFAFTLGDVSGKGIPAAVMMASIQTLLRSLLQRKQEDLASVLGDLNQTLYESSTSDRYSTLVCGMISPDRTKLEYANAAHIPPFVLRRDGTLIRLPGSDVPVGMFPNRTYRQHEFTLTPGDTLVIVSDGIVEAQNPSGDFWEEASVEAALRNIGPNAESASIPGLLCQDADAWASGTEQYDDMTVVAVRVTD